MTAAEAYPHIQREAHAEQCILWAAEGGWLEATISARIAQTYGLDPSHIAKLKALKAKFRNELSFSGGDK
jgi:hypothetical protein